MTDRDPDQVEKIAFALSRLASSLPDACRSDHPLMSRVPNEVAENGLNAVAQAIDDHAQSVDGIGQAISMVAEQLKRIADHMTQPPPPQPKTMVGHRLPENEP